MLTPLERRHVGLDDELDSEERTAVTLAIGRLFRILSRPHRPGDEEQYERCRSVVMAHVETKSYEPNIAAVRRD
jgi:hypothetical protein